jgi:hypothetical protein
MEKHASKPDRQHLITTILDRKARGFSRYVPVAEKMFCLISQTPTLRRREEYILRQVIAGTSMQNIGKIQGVSRQCIHQIEHRALSRMFYEYPLLVSKFNEFRREKFIPDALPSVTKSTEILLELNLEPKTAWLYKKEHSKIRKEKRRQEREYYYKHRKKLLAERKAKYRKPKIKKKILEYMKEYYKQNKARIIKRQRKYRHKRDVREHRIRYMEKYHQKERENKILF